MSDWTIISEKCVGSPHDTLSSQSDTWEAVQRDLDQFELSAYVIQGERERPLEPQPPPIPKPRAKWAKRSAQSNQLIEIEDGPSPSSVVVESKTLPSHDSDSATKSFLDLNVPFEASGSQPSEIVSHTSIRLLLKEYKAFKFNTRLPSSPPRETSLPSGSLLKPTCELDDDVIVNYLIQAGAEIPDMVCARDCILYDTYTVVNDRDTIKLSKHDADILLPMMPYERLEQHGNKQQKEPPAREAKAKNNSPDNSAVQDTGFMRDGHSSVCVPHSSNGQTGQDMSMLYRFVEGNGSWSSQNGGGETSHRNGSRTRFEERDLPPPPYREGSSSSSAMSAPRRSQSAHSALGPAQSSYSVDDPSLLDHKRVGARVIWNKDNVDRKATILWIGRLKGHSSIYAGVEFDEPIGEGTGVYHGQEIFNAKNGYAGFLLLSVLRLAQTRTSSRDMVAHARHKQRSTDALLSSSPPAPPLPPRPQFRAEDYMIDSFALDSCVEVCMDGMCRSGVVRWLGDALSRDADRLEKSAVVELESDVPLHWRPARELEVPATQDMHNGVLVPVSALRRDRRFEQAHAAERDVCNGMNVRVHSRSDFGSIDSGVESTPCQPSRAIEPLLGRMKGIQGNRNSCYLDAMLYTMFVQTNAFDFLLERKPKSEDIPQYEQLQTLLATEIVYPLRRFHYVRADHVMQLRELLATLLPAVSGLMSEEKDPEEILNSIFTKLLKTPPFLEILNNDGKVDHTHFCPLIVENFTGGVVTTQHLLERSMREANVRFRVPPRLLILQMPRYGQQKIFDRIVPLEQIEITPLVHGAAVSCARCSTVAEMWCPECFLTKRVLLPQVSYCMNCFKEVHQTSFEGDHLPRNYYPPLVPAKKSTPIRMSLMGVISIEMSHYVSFVRSQAGPWLFFDSMADRQGLDDGFNVPQVRECERMGGWLTVDGWKRLQSHEETLKLGGKGPEGDPLVTRIMSDSYICFYTLDDANPRNSSVPSEKFANIIRSTVAERL